MPAALPIAGMALGALGSAKQADATKDAAQLAQFNPFNVSGPGGTSTIQDGQINMGLSGQQQGLFDALGGTAMQGLSGAGPNAQFADQFRQLGGQALPGAFGGVQNAPGMGGLFSQFQGQVNPMAQMLGAGGIMGLQGAQPQFGGLTQQLAQQGQGMFNTDVSGIINDRFNALSQQAAPGEERAFNSLQNRLFSQGRLGSTGGSRDFEAFGRGLGDAQLSRQMAAQNLGLQTQAQQAGIGSQLFGAAQGFGGLDLNRLTGGLGAASNAFGQAGGLFGNVFGAGAQSNQADFSRALQRMQAAQGMFGFGQGLNEADFGQGLQALGGQQSIEAGLRANTGLGLEGGAAGASAGANQARIMAAGGSPVGGFLSSLGSGLFDFGQSRTSTPTTGGVG